MKNNGVAGWLPPTPHHAAHSRNPDPKPAKGKALATQCPGGKKRTPRREIPSDRPGFRRFEFFEPIPEAELSAEQIRRTAAMNLNRRESRSQGGFMPSRPIEI